MGRVGRADGQGDTTERARRQALLEPLPGEAAVGGAVDSAPSPARLELPGVAHELPQTREQHAWVAGDHDQVRHAGRVVHEEYLLPCLAAVRRPEDAAFGVGRPHVPEGGYEDDVRIRGVDHDAGDLPDIPE